MCHCLLSSSAVELSLNFGKTLLESKQWHTLLSIMLFFNGPMLFFNGPLSQLRKNYGCGHTHAHSKIYRRLTRMSIHRKGGFAMGSRDFYRPATIAGSRFFLSRHTADKVRIASVMSCSRFLELFPAPLPLLYLALSCDLSLIGKPPTTADNRANETIY